MEPSAGAMRRLLPILPLLALAACKPPASDDYVTRVAIEERAAPAEPIQSPDTEDAAWVSAGPWVRLDPIGPAAAGFTAIDPPKPCTSLVSGSV